MLWFYESFYPAVWISFFLYWQIKAANTKTTQRLEPAASRILRVFIFLIAIVLLSTTRIPLPWLYLQLWPAGLWPFWLGAAVTLAGLLLQCGRAGTSEVTGAAPYSLGQSGKGRVHRAAKPRSPRRQFLYTLHPGLVEELAEPLEANGIWSPGTWL